MPLMPPVQPTSALIRRLALQRGLDPAATLAVASTEGGLENRESDIGDLAGGGSYGPFQLYAQGALPARFRGRPKLADQWAWSPKGIDYALGLMVSAGAAGLKGKNAINTIVRKFERPADPNSQVAKALALYGRFAGGAAGGAQSHSALPGPSNPSTPAINQSTQGNPFRNHLLAGLSRGDDIFDLISSGASLSRFAPVQAPMPQIPSPRAGAALRTAPTPSQGVLRAEGTQMRGPIEELIYDAPGAGSIFNGVRSTKPYGGHGKHLHFADPDPQDMLRAIALAQRLGLAVRENPYTDPVDPVHTKNSHHYRVFPGLYQGKKLGQGADISGDPAKLRQLFQMLAG